MERRTFLKVGLAAVTSVCWPEVPVFASAWKSLPSNYIFPDDPVYRACTLTLSHLDEENKLVSGQGSLINNGGRFGILTATHVIEKAGKNIVVQFPGVTQADVELTGLIGGEKRNQKDDPGVIIPLASDLSNLMEKAIKSSVLTPLKLAPLVVMPKQPLTISNRFTGEFDRCVIERFEPRLPAFVVKTLSSIPICGGQSGAPMLLVKDGLVLPEVAGVVISFYKKTRVENPYAYVGERECGMEILVRNNLGL